MDNLVYQYAESPLTMVYVSGTGEQAYWFGIDTNRFPLQVGDFWMSALTVTQALWKHIMGQDANLSRFRRDDRPVEHVSWDDINRAGGFLERLNNSEILSTFKKQAPTVNSFRLPSEAEWEYAARGGKNWRENLLFSGSDNADEVAWYKANSGNQTHPAGKKAPNQLGIYDLCGNVWEWCQDIHTYDTSLIPKNGLPYLGEGTARILRGGCHHNGAVHCTVSKRYEIVPGAADECIGFRLVLA